MKKSRNIKNLRDFLKNRMNVCWAISLKHQNLAQALQVVDLKQYFLFRTF